MEERSDRSSLPNHLCKYTYLHNPTTSRVSGFLFQCFLYAEGCTGTLFLKGVPVQCSTYICPG